MGTLSIPKSSLLTSNNSHTNMIWILAPKNALTVCTLFWAHAFLSACFFERTLIWAKAFLSARFSEHTFFHRTLFWVHAFFIAPFHYIFKARFARFDKKSTFSLIFQHCAIWFVLYLAVGTLSWKLILLRIELCMQCLLCSLFFILHSSQDLYLGSGNLGSRCTTRTKEIGMLASKCPSLAMVTKRSHSMSKSLKKSHFASLRAKRAFFALDFHTKNYHHFRHEN